MKKSFLILTAVTVLLSVTFTSCEEDVKTIDVQDISLDITSKQICPGDPFTLVATIDPVNATNQKVTWATDNPAVATVSGDGLTVTVTGVAVGNTNIKVKTVDGEITKTCRVTVVPKTYPVQSVSLAPQGETIGEIGGTLQLTPYFEPENATNKSVEYTTSDDKIATVDKNTGLVTAVGCGTATITVTTSDGGKTNTADVIVNVRVSDVKIQAAASVYVGATGDMKNYQLEVLPATACNKTVTWKSDNSTAVTIDPETGLFEAVGEGKANITVTTVDGGKFAICTITSTIYREPVGGIDFEKAIKYDFTGAKRPDFFNAELKARFISMDLNYVFFAGREEHDPVMFSFADLKSGTVGNPIGLFTGTVFPNSWAGRGTGRYAHGHVYCTNLATGGLLRIIHWDMTDPYADPDPQELIVLTQAQTESKRYGDNMSVDLDPSGNGYLFFNGSATTRTLSIPVTNFTTLGEPVLILPRKMSESGPVPMEDTEQTGPFAAFHRVDGKTNEYMISASWSSSPVKLIERSGTLLYQMKTFGGTDGCAAQVVSFNNKRYLVTWNGVRTTRTIPDPPYEFVLAIYDITRGETTADALMNFDSDNEAEDDDGEIVYKPKPAFEFILPMAVASASDGGTAVHIEIVKDGDNKLYVAGSVVQGGFVIFEFPKLVE